MNCPHCSVSLVSETYEGVTIDRCPSCSGTWLDTGELTHILETRTVKIPSEIVGETLALATAGMPGGEVRTLVGCPRCQGPMDSFNFDHTSGIVIDHCPVGHGNWLDASELEKVQAHREYWADREGNPDRDVGTARSVIDRMLRALVSSPRG